MINNRNPQKTALNVPFTKYCATQQGFSLVEVLIALTIFAIGLLAISGMQITAIKTNSSANTRAVETDIATSILNEITTWPISSFVDEVNIPWVFNSGDESVVGGGTYAAEYTIAVDYNGVANLVFIQVNVQQTNGLQRTYSVTGFKRGI